MLGKMIRMDMRRGGSPMKLAWKIAAVSTLMVISSWEFLGRALAENAYTVYGAVDLLEQQMQFDSYKTVILLLFASVYTGSICQDIRTRYQRMILYRVDIQKYVISRFFSNTLLIVLCSVLSCYLFSTVIIALGFPVITEDAKGGLLGASFYVEWMKNAPYLYIGFVGLQFGMIAAAFSSIGLLFSAYLQNSFVCVGVSGFVFFIAISLSAFRIGMPFDVLSLVGMKAVLPAGQDTPYHLMAAWGMLYPLLVISICSLLFCRKMKARVCDGRI